MSLSVSCLQTFYTLYPDIILSHHLDMSTITQVAYVRSTMQQVSVSHVPQNTLIIIERGATVVVKDARCENDFKKLFYYIQSGASLRMICEYTAPVDYADINITCIVEADAQCEINVLSMHAKKTECTLTLLAIGVHAQIQVRGAYLLKEQEHFVMNSYQKHYTQSTTSSLDIRGIIHDQAKASFNGLIFIDEQAQHTDASQSNKNILLSDHAQAHSVPAIEVLTNDVQCSHASAIGKLDPEQMWYMQSRGISKDNATQLLLQGFLSDLFSEQNLVKASLQYLKMFHLR